MPALYSLTFQYIQIADIFFAILFYMNIVILHEKYLCYYENKVLTWLLEKFMLYKIFI